MADSIQRLLLDTARKERLEGEIAVARTIQQKLLPPASAELSGLTVLAHVQSVAEIGGDYYDYLPTPDGRIAIAIGDVSGHGLPTGLLVAMAKAALVTLIDTGLAGSAIFSRLNDLIHRSTDSRSYMTLALFVYDTSSRRAELTNAGQLAPYRVSAARIETRSLPSFPLGVSERTEFATGSWQLAAGDKVVFLSDGLVECRDPSGDLFGFERLEQILEREAVERRPRAPGRHPAGGRGVHGRRDARRRPNPRDRHPGRPRPRSKGGLMRHSLLAALLALGTLGSAAAQTSPFVDEKTERLLVNELSGDRAFETLRITTQWHKPSASEGFFAVARYVMERAREAGLEDVKWIDQVADSTPWTGRSAEAWLVEGEGPDAKETKLASVAEVGDLSRRLFASGEGHGGDRRRGIGRERRGLQGKGRPGKDRARVRQPGDGHGTGRLETGRGRHPRLVVDEAERARRRAGPGRVAARSREGWTEGGKDHLRVRPLGAGRKNPVGPAPRGSDAANLRDGRRDEPSEAPCPGRRRLRHRVGEEDGDGRRPSERNRPEAARDRSDRASPGVEVLGE